MKLDFGLNQWFIVEGQQPAWVGVGFSTKGSFEVRTPGGIWRWDKQPGKAKQNTVILWDVPMSAGDSAHGLGVVHIRDPKDLTFKDGKINGRSTPDPAPFAGRCPSFAARHFRPHRPPSCPTKFGSTGHLRRKRLLKFSQRLFHSC